MAGGGGFLGEVDQVLLIMAGEGDVLGEVDQVLLLMALGRVDLNWFLLGKVLS